MEFCDFRCVLTSILPDINPDYTWSLELCKLRNIRVSMKKRCFFHAAREGSPLALQMSGFQAIYYEIGSTNTEALPLDFESEVLD